MAEIHYMRLSEIREKKDDFFKYGDILADIDRPIDDDEAKHIIDEIDNAIMGEGRLQSLESDPLIDIRVSAMMGNFNISINASDLGKGMPESIAVGIINVNGNTLETKHRYSKDRQEVVLDAEELGKNMTEIEELYKKSRELLEKEGFKLEEAGDDGRNYMILNDKDIIAGELLLGKDERDNISSVYLRDLGGRTNDIGSENDITKFVDKLVEYQKLAYKEPEEIPFENATSIDEAEKITALDEFVGAHDKGIKIKVGENENGAITYGLMAEDIRRFVEEKDIKAESAGEYADKICHALRMEYERGREENLIEVPQEQPDENEPEFINIEIDEEKGESKEMENFGNVLEQAKRERMNSLKEELEKQGYVLEEGLIKYDNPIYTIEKDGETLGHIVYEGEGLFSLADKDGKNLELVSQEEVMNRFSEKVIEQEKEIDLELNADMSEREMASKIVEYMNQGKEASPEQEKWINSHSNNDKTSAELKEELEGIREDIKKVRQDIKADEEKLASLNKQLDRHVSIAKMNGCKEDDLKKIKGKIDDISQTTASLNKSRSNMANLEEQEVQKLADIKEAQRYERAQAIRSSFGKVQDTLSKSVKTGIGALGKIKDSIERVNIKAMSIIDLHERTNAYKDLAREVNEINKEYVRDMTYLKEELTKNTDELQKVTEKAERAAQIRGTIKDLGRLLTGREAQHDYSLNDKEREKIASLKDSIQNTKDSMSKVDTMYERTVSPKQQELKDWGKELENRGKSVNNVFSDVIKNAYDRAGNQAKEMHEEHQKMAEAR